jgi:hypothetical protein
LDVPEDGESNGMASLTFAWLDLEFPSRIEREEERGGSNGWKKE